MDFIIQDGKNKIIYFHNLSFDGDFIIKWLFRNYPKNFKQDYQFTTENYEVVNQVPKYNWFSFFKNGNKIYNIDWAVRKKIRDKVENIIVETDFDYDKNRSVQHYFVYLTSGERFDATTIKELKEKARQMN